MNRAFILTGLGFGDEGKGTTTDWLARKFNAHTIIRTGGPQALHSVLLSDGREHTFSHFGSASLAGAKTFLSQNMLVDPYAILEEGRALQKIGVSDIFDITTIHKDALIITPFQAIANRLWELSRKSNRRGTVGIGVGETVVDSEVYPEITIRAEDLAYPDILQYKLRLIRELKLNQLRTVLGELKYVEAAAQDIENLNNPQIVDWAIQEFVYCSNQIRIIDDAHAQKIFQQPGVLIFEPSQGVLLDRYYGFHPYTTKARPLPEAANEILNRYGYEGKITRLGITRAYHTRHGAGPFVAEDDFLSKNNPDMHNGNHPWQGGFRVGPLDLIALKYAIKVADHLDGLVLTCLDRLTSFPDINFVTGYQYQGRAVEAYLEKFFCTDGNLISGVKVRRSTSDADQLNHQAELANLLKDCRPVLNVVGRDIMFDIIPKLESLVGLGVKIISNGPTEKAKRLIRSI